ncbi:class I SAM-dependent methyltransferase [Halobacillus shinanisalinarum]|uniref:Class I SAM-dependent methyltransferase n=1 Tax=Halobacillus shinanisalinarum TaxID=2932258 RepID=A0ABY4GVK2_9BACI|nr:class I SAM-dependent methyltransferase [Halobacillus shinanisalinarum]UOQ91745.1 class I SAM-dependent methyltransferase [Halobacillus shinanisalinarum]
MEYKGPSAYDNEQFLDNFLARRNREESPNNTMEHPAFMKFLGDVSQRKILDLGCGDAQFGVELLEQGCASYEGVEGSSKMTDQARSTLGQLKGKVFHSSMEDWDYPHDHYDVIISRVSFHYIEKLQPVFKKIHQSLRENGRFVFSVQHPVLTSSQVSAEQSSKKFNWVVDNYFECEKRVEPWINEKVVKYHRTFEEYFRLVKGAGFKIDDVSECTPRRDNFNSEEEYERRKRIPLFLIFACQK